MELEVVLYPGMIFEPNPAMRTYRVRAVESAEVDSLRAENVKLRGALRRTHDEIAPMERELSQRADEVESLRAELGGAQVHQQIEYRDGRTWRRTVRTIATEWVPDEDA